MSTRSSSLYDLLRVWLAPTDVDTFRRELWAKRPLFRAAAPWRLDPVLPLGVWDVHKLMKRHAGDVVAWFQAPDGRHSTAPVRPEAAHLLYQGGVTIYVREAADLRPLEAAMAAALALPEKGVRCGIFFNHPGAKTRAHFDPVDTITLQIKGRKRWRIAPNEHAPLPTAGWATLDRAPAPDLRFYAEGPLPAAMPAGAEEYTLEPGAVLYVPQGYWHETDSDEESVSLHVHLLPVAWVDALLAALRAKLLADPRFRGPANDLWAPQARAEVAEVTEGLLRDFAAAAGRLSADDVLPTPAPSAGEVRPNDRFVRRPLAGLWVEPSPAGGGARRVTLAVSEHGRERETSVQMPPEHLEACRLFTQGADAPAWSAAELAARTPGLSCGQALELVQLLLDARYVRRV
ncbi:MAG TPA: cupin domain-containing protein [Polyangiaceae bacterium]|nr:cupin domain-containing protein [Polyangiaceae bacterium]